MSYCAQNSSQMLTLLVSGDLKRICEIDLGLVSQCCCTKQVFKMNKQILANLALKINVKVGGLVISLLIFVWIPSGFV